MSIKKKIKMLFISVFTIFCILGNFVNASSTAYDIGEYIIDATIMKNGDLHIVEKIRFDFFEEANGIYRDVLYRYNYSGQKDDMKPESSRYQASNVKNVSVYKTNNNYSEIIEFNTIKEENAQNGMQNVFSLTNFKNENIKRIKIYSPSSSEEIKYMKIEYDIENVAVLYNNKGEIYWNFVGNGWDCSISNLKINIDFEGVSNKEIKMYPHAYADIQNVINLNGNLSFEVPKVSSGKSVDARVVFSDEYLNRNDIEKVVNENYNFEQLEKLEKNMEIGKTRYKISNIIIYVIVALVIIYYICIIIKSRKISSKGKKKKPEYYTKPLENLNLSVYNKLNNGVIPNSNIFMATILDLKQKKILEMDAKEKIKKSFDGIEYDYYLTINENADFEKLYDYERIILNYLFNEEAKLNITGFKEVKIELNKKLKEMSKKYDEVQKYIKLCTEYDKKVGDIIFEKTDKKFKITSIISFLVIVLISLINNFVISPLSTELKFLNFWGYFSGCGLAFIFSIIFIYVRSIKSNYYEEYNKLKGLERYLKEYSLIKDRYPIEIALWDRYLVFATLFGIAKKVAKEFKDELIKNGYNDEYIYTNYPVLNMSMYSTQISSYSSGSTGGYSGSGSGGGGRRWRRRWFLLAPPKGWFCKIVFDV